MFSLAKEHDLALSSRVFRPFMLAVEHGIIIPPSAASWDPFLVLSILPFLKACYSCLPRCGKPIFILSY